MLTNVSVVHMRSSDPFTLEPQTGAESDMDGKPKRLRPWLESLINSREIAGLQWENEERTMFRIPWKHRGKHDWSPENSRIFMEWAKQTGRYREGIDPPDYPAWKTRLRCAFNKAPDIEEVKDMSRLDATNPYRVYHLKPSSPSSKTGSHRPQVKRLCSGQVKVIRQHSHENRRYGHTFQQMQGHPNVKTENDCYTGEHHKEELHYYNGCSPPHLSSDGPYFAPEVPHGYQSPGSAHLHQQFQTDFRLRGINHTSGCAPVKLEVDSSSYNSTSCQPPTENDCEMVVQVMYCGKEVLQRTIESPVGCRISYGSCPLSPFGQLGPLTDFVENIYGPSQAESIVLPPCVGRMMNEKQEKLGMDLLERGLRRGVVLTCRENNIHAYRLCQSAVFYSTQPGTGGKPVKLRRADTTGHETTKLFDYSDQYIPALKDYLDGLGDKPDPRCYLVFGQEASMFTIDSTILIVVAVASRAALNALEKAEAQMSVRTPKVEVSNPTELDALARTLMNLYPSPGAINPSNLSVQYSPDATAVPSYSGEAPWGQSAACHVVSGPPESHCSGENLPIKKDEEQSS